MSGTKVSEIDRAIATLEREVLSEFKEGKDFDVKLEKIAEQIDELRKHIEDLNPDQPLSETAEEQVLEVLDKIRAEVGSVEKEIDDVEGKIDTTRNQIESIESKLSKEL